jgi:hypothetical protein
MSEPQSLGVFGARTDEELEELDAPPIPFEIVGYERKPDEDGVHAEAKFEFHVRPTLAFGPYFAALQQADINGNLPTPLAVKFIGQCVIEEEREDWLKTLDDPELEFHTDMLAPLAQALMARYGQDTPTGPRSVRRATQRKTGRTSTAGRSAKASTSGRSTPATRTA